jgi:hypothetical protein
MRNIDAAFENMCGLFAVFMLKYIQHNTDLLLYLRQGGYDA